MDDGFVFTSLRQLSRAFRISYNTAKDWRGRGLPAMPKTKAQRRDSYCLPDVIEWLVERRAAAAAPGAINGKPGEDEPVTKSSLDIQNAKLDLEAKQLRLYKEMGSLVDRDAAKAEQRQQNTAIRTQLEALPGRLSKIFPPEHRDDLVSELEHHIYLLLKNFSLLGEKENGDGKGRGSTDRSS